MSLAGRAIGLDVHLEFCEVAVCEIGEVRSAGRVESKPEALEVLAASLLATDRVALEVMGASWEIVRILEPHVAKVIVVSPGVTGIAHARAKTDRLDARTLARLLWVGDLDGAWTPDEPTQVLRRRLSRREQLVRPRSRSRERDPRGTDAPVEGPLPVLGHVREGRAGVVALVGAAGRGVRDGRVNDASDRVPRLRDSRGRPADRDLAGAGGRHRPCAAPSQTHHRDLAVSGEPVDAGDKLLADRIRQSRRGERRLPVVGKERRDPTRVGQLAHVRLPCCHKSDRCNPARRPRARQAHPRQTGVTSSPAPVVGVHAPSGAAIAQRGSRPGRPAAPNDPRPEPTDRPPADAHVLYQTPRTHAPSTGRRPLQLVGLGRSPVRGCRAATWRSGCGRAPIGATARHHRFPPRARN